MYDNSRNISQVYRGWLHSLGSWSFKGVQHYCRYSWPAEWKIKPLSFTWEPESLLTLTSSKLCQLLRLLVLTCTLMLPLIFWSSLPAPFWIITVLNVSGVSSTNVAHDGLFFWHKSPLSSSQRMESIASSQGWMISWLCWCPFLSVDASQDSKMT